MKAATPKDDGLAMAPVSIYRSDMEDVDVLKSAIQVLRRYGFSELAGRVDVARSAVSHLARAITEVSGDQSEAAAAKTPTGDTPGARLRSLRRAARLSAEALGESAGLSAVSVRAHENGQNGIKPEVAERYAQRLGVAPSAILFGA
ncbi:helix-turn-helix domain-containing protein [uncultured Brevundimonas sp.]|uniref:helix-turn-helix domain-containing protein n=1 Tax=uncultured Brevundimonas sp. TaxID=213418 RepID=UPI0025D523F5|nr:helix-turn-helix domain-containing protein [uncultured Brevundimonas sp.]